MRKALLMGGILLIGTGSVLAEAAVRIQSDVAANVYVDGQLVGTTPLTVEKLAPGMHEIRVEHPGTRESRVASVKSPEKVSILKEFSWSFDRPARRRQRPARSSRPRYRERDDDFASSLAIALPLIAASRPWYPGYGPYYGSHHGPYYGYTPYGYHAPFYGSGFYGRHGFRSGFSFGFGGCY